MNKNEKEAAGTIDAIEINGERYISLESALSIGKNNGIIKSGDAIEEYIQALISAKRYSDMTPEEAENYTKSIEALNSRYLQNMDKAFKIINPDLITPKALLSCSLLGTYPIMLKLLNEAIDFAASTEWEFYCSQFVDFKPYMRAMQSHQKSGLDIAAVIDNCRDLTQAAPFVAQELDAYKKGHDATTIRFSAFTKDVLPRCLNMAKKPQNPAKYAASQGAILSIGNRLMILSNPDYQNSFITSTNARYGLRILNSDDSNERGKLAFDINIPFLQGLLKAVYTNTLAGGNGDIKVYWPTIAKELGLDATRDMGDNGRITRKQARKLTLEGFIIEIQKLYAPVPGREGYAQIISVPWYDPNTEIFKFNSPYMQTLIYQNLRREQRALESGKKSANWHCDLMHATATNERNKAAVEMAQRVLVGVQQRGTTKPDAKLSKYRGSKVKDQNIFEWHISFMGLIGDCPQIRDQLERQKSTSNKTHVLQRSFKAMYRILRDKTDLYKYYIDLSVSEIIPTWSTLSDTNAMIHIRHYGRNPNYTQPQLTLPEYPTQPCDDTA